MSDWREAAKAYIAGGEYGPFAGALSLAAFGPGRPAETDPQLADVLLLDCEYTSGAYTREEYIVLLREALA